MKTKVIATTLSLLFSAPAIGFAGWAALDEVPLQTGELRLVEPMEGDVGFPVKAIQVDARVDGIVATVSVDQLFENPYDHPIEAVYLFPLSDGAAVHAYRIAIGERVIEGEIREAERARREYQQAKEQGRTAALVEQQRANVFTQSVANVPPHQSVRVQLTYVEQLPFEDGGYEMVFPLVAGPRFLPGHTEDPAPVKTGEYGTSGIDVRMNVRLAAGVPLVKVESPSHRLSQHAFDEATRTVSVADVPADRDFVLRWQTAGDRTYVGLLTHRDQRGGFFTLVVQPKLSYESNEITGREVVFLVDRSGSMSGAPIIHARDIVESLVRSLREQDTFDIIAFSDRSEACAGRPVPATEANKRRAIAWAAGLRAGGGTQLLDGVTRALLTSKADRRVRHVVVVTDGEVGNDDEILNAVAKYGSHNRIFPVGVGAAPNRYLLDRLAGGARGFASYVAVNETIDATVDQIVRRTSRPYLTGIEIDWNDLQVYDVRPRVLPDVYAGQPLVVSGRFDRQKKAKVRVLGRMAGGAVDIPLEVDLGGGEDHDGVAFVWAKRKIDELLAEDYTRTDARVKREVTQIGLAHALVTPYTSFVAIDRGRVVGTGTLLVQQVLDEPANEAPQQVYAAVPPQMSHSPATASEPQREHKRSWSGGGGGGDLDPVTIMTIIGAVPVAWHLRRRKQAKPRASS